MKSRLTALFVILAVSICSAAFADTLVFSDNFNSENGGSEQLNYAGFANWTITDGTVDLIGNGGNWDFYPGNGMYVDLDGSTWKAGIMTSKAIPLAPGTYELSFDLGGNARQGYGPDTVTVQVVAGSAFSHEYTMSSSAPLQTITEIFEIKSAGNYSLQFSNFGGDNVGAILDNVSLKPVPEPTSLLLLGSGLSVIGLAAWRKRK